jgi:hypothetical protein
MDLREFVAATLKQIVEGISESAEAVSKLGGAVSPAFDSRAENRLGTSKDGAGVPVYGVSFDVAVIAGSSDSKEAGAGLRVVGFGGLGGKLAESAKQEITSRVQFVVPLQLPVDPTSRQAAEAHEREKQRSADEATRKIRGAASA